jgi:hypothetical protein
MLAITGGLPKDHASQVETIRKFFDVASGNKKIRQDLGRLKITDEEIKKGLEMVEAVEAGFAESLRYKGLSQNSTVSKDHAFMKLYAWMHEFRAVTKIALRKQPELLDSLGNFCK